LEALLINLNAFHNRLFVGSFVSILKVSSSLLDELFLLISSSLLGVLVDDHKELLVVLEVQHSIRVPFNFAKSSDFVEQSVGVASTFSSQEVVKESGAS
jgi:hypothetical protein